MRKKLKLRLDKYSKKGYLQIDAAFALFIFILIFFYVFTLYNFKIQNYETKLEQVKLNSNAQDVCFLLTKTSGLPNNWQNNISNMKQLGLTLNNSDYINSNKLNLLNSTNYGLITNDLGLYNLQILVYNMSSNSLLVSFGVNQTERVFGSYNCYANLNQTILKFNVRLFS